MKISTILDHIASGHIALLEFQRGYVWNREQVRGLFDSLYRRHPVGGRDSFDFADEASGEQRAVFDLAWPDGWREELSQPVAVLLNEDAATVALASQTGFRCFTSGPDFRRYVTTEVLAGMVDA